MAVAAVFLRCVVRVRPLCLGSVRIRFVVVLSRRRLDVHLRVSVGMGSISLWLVVVCSGLRLELASGRSVLWLANDADRDQRSERVWDPEAAEQDRGSDGAYDGTEHQADRSDTWRGGGPATGADDQS